MRLLRTAAVTDQLADRRAAQFDGQDAIPYRITMALDLRQMYGPGVDEACGVAEPAVDRWESGDERPTPKQVQRLAVLTDMPLGFFYLRPDDVSRGPIWICRNISGSQPYCPPPPVLAPKPGAPFSPERLL
jgi:hypothetical protein